MEPGFNPRDESVRSELAVKADLADFSNQMSTVRRQTQNDSDASTYETFSGACCVFARRLAGFGVWQDYGKPPGWTAVKLN